ncbi:hypothetical protein MLD38_038782 [Melastoma candidum]|uniref:Uncharacterized protein n=1 Tax=Melastoma candidum TaxID=119954 RepID=A0ACB9L161_9MYRT|nr:hypothetical protein MLD38_038782 [Melastoma candidum]
MEGETSGGSDLQSGQYMPGGSNASTSPNADGIHISLSHDIRTSSCEIGTGDDCISIVGNSSVIAIRNISCGPGHGIRIESLGISKSWSQVRDTLAVKMATPSLAMTFAFNDDSPCKGLYLEDVHL